MDSIAITYALLDPIMTVMRPIAAFFTAVIAGFLENLSTWKPHFKIPIVPQSCTSETSTTCGCESEGNGPIGSKSTTIYQNIVEGLRYAVIDVWGDIVLWFYVGLIIAALITVLIPDALMVSFLGGGIGSMFIMLLVGVPLYICATASTPVAAALILKGVSPGAALVFLLVGPATNVTSISVLFGVLGKKSTFRYLAVLSLSAVLFGLGVDQLYGYLQISPKAVIGEAAEIVPYSLKIASVVILVLFSIKPLYQQIAKFLKGKKGHTHFTTGFPTPPSGTKGPGIRKVH